MSEFKDSLTKILLKKFQENSLASLYLITYGPDSITPLEWVKNFTKELTPINDHPDILNVFKEEKVSEYKVESPGIKTFLQFINYRPLKLAKKFIFLFDAQDLSLIVSNKLLKVFEEMSGDTCLILLAPHDAPLLPTVSSRAIKLKMEQSFKKAGETKESFLAVHCPQDLVAHIKKSNESSSHQEKKFIEAKIEECLARCSSDPTGQSYQALTTLLETLKDYETTSAFNNSLTSRMTPFFP